MSADVNMTALLETVEQLEGTVKVLKAQVDMSDNYTHFFLVVMGCIVFLMQAGFAFLEAGSVRSKNTTNILIKNMLDSCIAAICYWAVGWAFAYGKPANLFIGYGHFFAAYMPPSDYSGWFFQYVFAATAATIVSGALAERCEFAAYFAYSVALTSFIYPVVTHWAWAEGVGWLNTIGYKDFAGSGVVHLTGGTCALVGAWLLGPRAGRWDANIELRGHSVPFAALGGFILMFGFFAFNGGSRLHIHMADDGVVVALAMFNTMLAGATSAIVMLAVEKLFVSKKWSLLMTINAALAGMVAACCGCDDMYQWAAVIVGCCAGLACAFISAAMQWAKIDDPIDAVAVHAGGGLVGLLVTPIVMNGGIVFWADGCWKRLGVNTLGAVAIMAWSGALIAPVFLLCKALNMFRVAADIEEEGLDLKKHGEPAYPLVAYGHGWMHIAGGNRLAMRKLSTAAIGDAAPTAAMEEVVRRISNLPPVVEEHMDNGDMEVVNRRQRRAKSERNANAMSMESPPPKDNVTVVCTDSPNVIRPSETRQSN